MMQNNKVIRNNYIIQSSIGKGAFGEVFKAIRIRDGINVALKIEQKTLDATRLIPEYKIYKKIIKRGCKSIIPKIYGFIQTTEYNIMVMELLWQSLDEIFTTTGKKFSIGTVLSIGIHIINIFQYIHNAGFVHRDIKPGNFLVGNIDRTKIYLTDFGLSKEYLNSQHRHIKKTFEHGIVGTARYSSIKMHIGIEPSRRDDLESIGYMLVYFAKGYLPWQGVCKCNDRDTMFEKIGNVKMSTSINILCEGLPQCFSTYINYCRDLKFDEKPNYELLIKLFSDTITENNLQIKYEWL